MTTKEIIIRRCIKSLQTKISNLNDVIWFECEHEITDIRKRCLKIMNQYKGDEINMSHKHLYELESLAERERKIIIISKKQKDVKKLIEKRNKFSVELQELITELYVK